MDLTPERLKCLEVIASEESGRMDHDEEALAPFCDEHSTLSTPDVFNQCHDAGWLRSFHSSLSDTSFVELTLAGRSALGLK